MSSQSPVRRTPGLSGQLSATGKPRSPVRDRQLGGIEAVLGLVVVMWIVELINTLDGNALDTDGIYARNAGRLWGILTSPFIHESFAHLISNTIPFLFLGVIIALEGAVRVLQVTLIVIVLGGLGTWLISPANASTIGASGVVFGYAGYLLARGAFNRSVLELLTGLVVAVIWGGALLTSLIPRYGVSWQGHLCGAIAGVIAAWLLSRDRRASGRTGAGTLPG